MLIVHTMDEGRYIIDATIRSKLLIVAYSFCLSRNQLCNPDRDRRCLQSCIDIYKTKVRLDIDKIVRLLLTSSLLPSLCYLSLILYGS